MGSGITLTSREAPVRVSFGGTAVKPTITALKARVVARASTPGLIQQIEAFNWVSNAWVIIDSRPASTGFTTTLVDVAANPNQYVQGSNSDMKMRISWLRAGPTLSPNWTAYIDEAKFIVNPTF